MCTSHAKHIHWFDPEAGPLDNFLPIKEYGNRTERTSQKMSKYKPNMQREKPLGKTHPRIPPIRSPVRSLGPRALSAPTLPWAPGCGPGSGWVVSWDEFYPKVFRVACLVCTWTFSGTCVRFYFHTL